MTSPALELGRAALLVAHEAAALAMRGYRTRIVPDKKGRTDLVTEFDRASEEHIRARLRELCPGVPIIGEEASPAGAAEPARLGLRFYVDPIDGTTNFVHGHPFWCVAIGLIDGDSPVAGAVVAPALGATWSGVVGQHSRRDDEPCRVSATRSLEDSLIATGFPQDRLGPENNFEPFIRVKRVAQAVRRCGSAAMDLCLVADGTYDGYWERKLHPWDVIAGSAILLAAGGRISAIGGGPPDYYRGYLNATNGLIHDELSALTR